MASNNKNIGNQMTVTVEGLLTYAALLALVLGLFFWIDDAYMSFWLRRFFIGLAGVMSTYILIVYKRSTLVKLYENRLVFLFLLSSTVLLLINSYTLDALFGRPLVHPSLMSLYSSISVGLLLTTLNLRLLLKYFYTVIFAWSIINFVFWASGDLRVRLGFLDSQVIYAAYLFAIGIMLGLWHYKQSSLSKKFIISSSTFLLLCLILSQTRSALLLLVIYVIYTYRHSLIKKKKIVIAITTSLLAVFLVFNTYFSRMIDMPYLIKSISYRTSLMSASIPDNKWKLIGGGGVGSVEWNIHTHGYRYDELRDDIKNGIIFESSHNYFIDLLVERGLIVTGLAIAIVASCFKRRLRAQVTIINSILAFSCAYLLMNNINIQMELIVWSCILLILFKNHQESN